MSTESRTLTQIDRVIDDLINGKPGLPAFLENLEKIGKAALTLGQIHDLTFACDHGIEYFPEQDSVYQEILARLVQARKNLEATDLEEQFRRAATETIEAHLAGKTWRSDRERILRDLMRGFSALVR